MSEESPSKSATMKIVGGKNPRPFRDRFNRLQRRSHLVLGRAVSPRVSFVSEVLRNLRNGRNNTASKNP
jgi:hypothetical protein